MARRTRESHCGQTDPESPLLVHKARQLRSVKIVSWDWLEDSLMKEHPMRELDYLLAPLVKCAKDAREKKKAVRKENIRRGSKSPKRLTIRFWYRIPL